MPSDGHARETTDGATPQPPHVCMHVVGISRKDQRVLREARALRDAGYTVTIVDTEPDPKRAAEEDFEGLHLRHIIMPSRFKPTRFKPYFLVKQARVRRQATRLMRQVNADAYHAHDANALTATYRAARSRRKPLVFDSHELPFVARHTLRDRFLGVVAKWQLSRLVPRCAAVVTVCEPVGAEIHRQYGGPRPRVIRNLPIYTPPTTSNRIREQLGLPETARIALYQGGIQPNRVLERVVLAAKLFNPGNYAVIMGYGQSVESLRALIEREGVGDRVKMLPAVPYTELLAWTASADLGLSVTPPDYSLSVKLSLPNKLFEYIMAGLPVLTSEMPAIVEVVQSYDVGRVIAPPDSTEIAKAINEMLQDPDGLARMRRNALQAAQRDLCWEAEQHRVADVYANLPGMPHPTSVGAPLAAGNAGATGQQAPGQA